MPAELLRLAEIKKAIDLPALIADTEQAFVAYSRGESIVPPVGYLELPAPDGGDVHIKCGYIRGAAFYVVKIASGIAGKSNGTMLIFRREDGDLRAILLDQGYLTDFRTAVAGAIVAKYLAPRNITRIGVIGSGVQARLQLRLLAQVTQKYDATVWARNAQRAATLCADLQRDGFRIDIVNKPRDLAARCNLIVTTTSAREPLLLVDDVRPGTHITAIGADAPGKQELDPDLVMRADLRVADSRAQCVDHGEFAHAAPQPSAVLELGDLISNPTLGRGNSDQITIADLTGVAVQDIAIATHVYKRARTSS